MEVKGKTALITGGASGLDKATLYHLHKAGANVVIADMNPLTGQQVCDELKRKSCFCGDQRHRHRQCTKISFHND